MDTLHTCRCASSWKMPKTHLHVVIGGKKIRVCNKCGLWRVRSAPKRLTPDQIAERRAEQAIEDMAGGFCD